MDEDVSSTACISSGKPNICYDMYKTVVEAVGAVSRYMASSRKEH